LLGFRFQQFELGGRYYVPLPKLTSLQVEIINQRLKAVGFRTSAAGILRAAKESLAVTVASEGLCWSNHDLTDILVPVVPSVLTSKKRPVSIRSLADKYFGAKRQDDGVLLRLSPRLETSSLWRFMRAADSCALTPDEHAVFSFLLRHSSLESEILTDYPTEGCRVRRIGRKQYYSSRISGEEAADTLRDLGTRGSRNSYLPRDSLLRLSSLGVRLGELSDVLRGLGEWCYFTPSSGSRKL
jgi:hypothetical protein